MSNELIDMSAFQGARPAPEFAVLDPTESLADGIGQSYAILSYKGKTWSLRHRGETNMFLRKDDQSPVSYLDVVILRAAPQKSKSYYPPNSYDPANPNTSPPICASLDGIKPDADVATPQAQACALCPHNQFKVGPDGRKRRDCSDFKRLAVFLLPTSSMQAIGEVLLEPVFLRVPPASLDPLAKYGESLAKAGFPFASVVTRVRFDPGEPHPKMLFSAIKPLTSQDAAAIMGLRDDAQAKRITGEEGKPVPAAAVLNAPKPAAPAAHQVQAPVTAAVTQPVSPPPAAPAPAPAAAPVSNVVPMTAAAAAQGGPMIEGEVVSRTVTDTPPADGLIAAAMAAQTVAPVQQAATTVQPAAQTAADVGESDADLDSQIATLLAKK